MGNKSLVFALFVFFRHNYAKWMYGVKEDVELAGVRGCIRTDGGR